MRLSAFRYWLALFLLLLLPVQASAQTSTRTLTANKGIVWEVQGRDCTVWLAGTLHFASPQFYPLPRSMERAFAKAEVLAVEADITQVTQDDMEQLSQMIAAPQGQTLSKVLTPKTLRAFKDAGLDLAPYEGLRPWYAVMTAVTERLGRLGYSPEYGLDLHYLQRAHAQGMPVVQLESVLGQFRLMQDLAGKGESGFMQFMLKDIGDLDKELTALFAQWRQGDAKGMNEELFGDLAEFPKLLKYYDAVYFKRNKGMAEKVRGFLKSGKNHLVLVGAGHLVGEKSVQAYLKRRGYAAKQL